MNRTAATRSGLQQTRNSARRPAIRLGTVGYLAVALMLFGCGNRAGADPTGPSAHAGRESSPSRSTPSSRPTPPARLPAQVGLQVAAQSQLPQLPNGCEVTSLSMLLSAAGRPVDKSELAARQPLDPTPVTYRAGYTGQDIDQVISWGNPDTGFVGSVYGSRSIGYGIYHAPLARLLDQTLPGRALDLTGQPFAAIQAQLAQGLPAVAWVTTTLQPVDDWVTWQSPTGPVRATRYEHAVLIVGYDATHINVNNPLNGQGSQPVDRQQFLAAWQQLGSQAVSFTPLG